MTTYTTLYVSEWNSLKGDLTNDCSAPAKCIFILFLPGRWKGGCSKQEGIKMMSVSGTRQI